MSHYDYLFDKLKSFGPSDKVKNTIALIEQSADWLEFLENNDYKQHINPVYIEQIVKDYYISKNSPVATISPDAYVPGEVPSSSNLSRHKRPSAIGESEPKGSIPSDIILSTHTEEIIGTRDGPTTMYSYLRQNGEKYNSWKRLHGGKRKSRRNRKSKKSRKKLRKSNRRR
jgi:hypothetical protein